MKALFLSIIIVLAFTNLAYSQACLDKTEGYESGFSPCRLSDGPDDLPVCTGSEVWKIMSYIQPNCADTSIEQAREGTYSLKYVHDYDNVMDLTNQSTHRCEYRWINTPLSFYQNTEVWLSFSIFFPTDWIPPLQYDYIVMQMHQDQGCRPGPVGPPITISILPNGTLSHRVTGGAGLCANVKTTNTATVLGSVSPGKWHDFVMHFKISYAGVGYCEVWFRSGVDAFVQKVDLHDINVSFNDTTYPYTYLKFGPYTWAWQDAYYPKLPLPRARPTPDLITLYYDSIKVDDDGVCTFEDMVPADLPALTGTITTPTSDPTYSTTSTPLTIEGTSTGASSVTCTNSLGGSCTCTGTNTWSCEAALLNGVNNIVVNFIGAAETDQDEIAVTKYLTIVDDQTVTFTSGLLYVDWQGTNNATVQMTASVDASSDSCNSFRVRWDTDPSTSDYYAWDTITTTGYETDTVSIRGNCDYTCADYDPYRFVLSQGYHVLYFNERETCVALASITFDEYTAPTPASPGLLGVYSATEGKAAIYSATGFPITE